MFEEEAEEYVSKYQGYGWQPHRGSATFEAMLDCYIHGATYGYNKANEWHYVKDGDLPEVDNRFVLCVCGDGYVDRKRHYTFKLLTRKEFPLFYPVYAWKEIVLPKEIE